MTDHLEIRGVHVATITVPPSTHLSRHTPATAIDLYHDDTGGWSVLLVPQPDTDETSPVSVVRVARYEHLAEILDDLHGRWPLQDVVAAVLDAGHRRAEPDRELLAL